MLRLYNTNKVAKRILFFGLSTETIHVFNSYKNKNIECIGFYDNKDHPLIIGNIQSGFDFI